MIPLTEFLNLCAWTVAASAKAQYYRSEFDAGLVPSFKEAEALTKPPSTGRGVYGVYVADVTGGHLADLPKNDAMETNFKYSMLGRSRPLIKAGNKTDGKGGGKSKGRCCGYALCWR